ncbi:hypothetical protein QNC52_004445 [Salmonella enterica]|nr:hypothetical protein [Salmonella enterica subsp. enterica]EFV1553974.1 hypothetical protein [Salmonella enterica]EJK0525506.1 hypothetical protein [Salmonella enterica]EJO1932746.1 hypothetical protein [Salmonella enterica]ELV7962663.1 hypothetical protein [Salmonella enterica]
MNIRAGKRIIPGMDITALLSTNDPDTLRQLALSLLEESRKKDASLNDKGHQIRLLKEALMLTRQRVVSGRLPAQIIPKGIPKGIPEAGLVTAAVSLMQAVGHTRGAASQRYIRRTAILMPERR